MQQLSGRAGKQGKCCPERYEQHSASKEPQGSHQRTLQKHANATKTSTKKQSRGLTGSRSQRPAAAHRPVSTVGLCLSNFGSC